MKFKMNLKLGLGSIEKKKKIYLSADPVIPAFRIPHMRKSSLRSKMAFSAPILKPVLKIADFILN